jgi:hypothetical protein
VRRALVIATVLLLGCAPLQAQSVITPSGLGATSPLGIPGSISSTGSGGSIGTILPSTGSTGTGIPLGATEIDPGGLGQLPGCGTTGSTGMTGSGLPGTFDGGGMSGSGMSASGCITGSTIAGSGGLTSGGSVTSLGGSTGSTLGGSAIPLGSTEINPGGLSAPLTVSPPVMTSPCVGATGMTGTSTSIQTLGSSC